MKKINTVKSMRKYQLLGLTAIVVVLGSIGAWAALTSIQGAIIANGTIAVESHSKKIQHREGGIVAEIAVKNGDQVNAGDLLVRLDDTEIKASLAIINSSLDELYARAARLKALRDGKTEIQFPQQLLARKDQPQVADLMTAQTKLLKVQLVSAKGRKEQLAARVGQLGDEITGLLAQAKARDKQSKLIAGEVASLELLLKRGLVPKTRVLALRRQKAALEGQKGDIEARIAKAKNQIGETKLQIIQLDDEIRTKALGELAEVAAKRAELAERRIAIASRLAHMVIRAPQKGYIHQLAIHTVGGVVAPGETIMLIIPNRDNLIIEARINPKDRDQVQVGQDARVRFPSFNQRTTPQVSARVVHVAADLTRLNDQTPPFYSVRLRLGKNAIRQLGDNKLVPGMPAESYIQTGARSPLSYLLQPLSDQIARAFRES